MRGPIAAALLALGLLATAAQAQRQSLEVCVSGDEAEGLVLALAPDAIQAVGQKCAGSLPPVSLFRQPSSPFIARYRAAADEAWGRARGALVKIAGPEAAGIVTSDYARPLLAQLIVPALTRDVKPKDCRALDRILGSLEPLPPRNTARLVVTILQLSAADDRAKGKKSALPICPLEQP